MKRREFLGAAGMLAVGLGAVGAGVTGVALAAGSPAAQIPARGAALANGTTLDAALRARQSQRAYAATPLPETLLLDLLWAACGINRSDGRRTAPTARNRQEIDVYVTRADGVYLYDAQAGSGSLVRKSGQDLRALTGTQSYVGTAPVNLVYVADMDKAAGGTAEEKLLTVGLDTGFVSQNVYLFCAAAGLASVARTSVDIAALDKALGLPARQRVVMAQCVGFPKV